MPHGMSQCAWATSGGATRSNVSKTRSMTDREVEDACIKLATPVSESDWTLPMSPVYTEGDAGPLAFCACAERGHPGHEHAAGAGAARSRAGRALAARLHRWS